MELSHSFTVPLGVEETWSHFQDIAALAECFPGAVVTGVEDDSFTGTVKVKLGPIALQYAGSGTFTERDDAAHRFVVEAKGKDKRGNGTAGATVSLQMADAGGATTIDVQTDLAITGKPAQFGRGVMQDVSDKLLGQFVACLEQRLAPADGPAGGTAEPAVAAVAAPTPAEPAAAGSTPIGSAAAAAAAAAPPVPRPVTPLRPPPAGSDDALDLGSAVLPVLIKSYGKQVGAGLGVLLVLLLIRRLLRG